MLTPGDVLLYSPKPKVALQLRCVAVVGDAACVVLTRSTGTTLPKSTRALLEIEPLTHHDWDRPLLGGWVSGKCRLRKLGHVKPGPGEADRVLHPSAWVKVAKKTKALANKVVPVMTWDALLDEVRLQWRWVNERKAVEREDAAREKEQELSLEQALIASHEAQTKLLIGGVDALARKRFFDVWKGEQPKAVISEAERIMKGLVKDLKGKTGKAAATRLAKAMQQFNELHEEAEFEEDASDDVLDALLVVAATCEVDAETFEKVVDVERAF